MECFIHHLGILHSLASHLRAHFTAKEIQHGAYAYGINWSYSHFPSPRSRWPNLKLEWLLEDTVVPIGRQYPKTMWFCLIEYSRCFESATVIWCLLSHRQNTWSGNQGVEVGVAALTLKLNNPFVELFFLPQKSWAMLWWKSWSPREECYH